jgi:hypothetical protein
MIDAGPRRRQRPRLVTAFLWAVALGLVVGVLGGEPRRVSVELWLAVATAWFAWLLIGQLTDVAPLRPDRIEGLLRRRRRPPPTDERARRLANLEGLIANAAHSQRAATIRLRPRLIGVADGLLRSHHGIDRATEPDRVAEVLGDVGWIVDTDAVMVRSPTPAEVEVLVARAGDAADNATDSDADNAAGTERRPEPEVDR